jgi:hypothetical protein
MRGPLRPTYERLLAVKAKDAARLKSGLKEFRRLLTQIIAGREK